MASKVGLPPLYISQLTDLPKREDSAQSPVQAKIEFARRGICNSEPMIRKKVIGEWSIQIYRDRFEKPDALVALVTDEDEEGDGSERQDVVSFEHLIFLFKTALASDDDPPVYVLSTRRAYKSIRGNCSTRFPRHCFAHLSSFFDRVQQVFTGQIFGPASDTVSSLRSPAPISVNQSGQICREFTVVSRPIFDGENENVKLKFKEDGILVYQDLSLENYIALIDRLALSAPNDNLGIIPTWRALGLPEGNLVRAPNQSELHSEACKHLVGLESNWTFSLSASERFYSSAMDFQICYERNYDSKGSDAIDTLFKLPNEEIHPQIDSLKQILHWKNIGSVARTFDLDVIVSDLVQKRISIKYRTMKGEEYSHPVIDCVEGEARTDKGDVFFKIGDSWYQIDQSIVKQVGDAFLKGIDEANCMLSPGSVGYLELPWSAGEKEVDYTRRYTGRNESREASPQWFDGNGKTRSWVELFDILQVVGDDVFIYHAKAGFNAKTRELATQLVTSAQVLFNTRYSSDRHPDREKTLEYCNRVCNGDKDQGRALINSLVKKKLHFVMAFQPNPGDPRDSMLKSASLYAKREVIRTKEAIEQLGFVFHLTPIPHPEDPDSSVTKGP